MGPAATRPSLNRATKGRAIVNKTFGRWSRAVALGVAAVLVMAACGDDDDDAGGSSATEAPSATAAGTEAPAASGEAGGAGITLAINPWTGSAVNAQVAKIVLESKLNTPTKFVEIDEFATWPGMEDGSIDAVLEVWPSGHAADYDTYVTKNKTVVDMGLLGPEAKIGWYVPSFVTDAHPELKTWEGFKNPDLAKLFATAESGDQGQFLMGDPSYVTYDEQIIKNLNLPLKFVVAGSEAALMTAIAQAETDKKPLLLQFWQPHWMPPNTKLTEVKLPDITPACDASRVAGDGGYACDYPVDILYKAANAKLESKNKAAFDFLSKFSLTSEQQNEVAQKMENEGKAADVAAKEWVDANPDVVASWLG